MPCIANLHAVYICLCSTLISCTEDPATKTDTLPHVTYTMHRLVMLLTSNVHGITRTYVSNSRHVGFVQATSGLASLIDAERG